MVDPGCDPLVCRPGRPEDAVALKAFYENLSPNSRRLRFMGSIATLSDALMARLTQIDYARDLLLVLESDRGLVGSCRYDLDPDGSSGEFALVVADELRGHGLGKALMQRMLEIARSRGLNRIQGEVLTENSAMLALMKRLGFQCRVDPHERSVTQVEVDLRVS